MKLVWAIFGGLAAALVGGLMVIGILRAWCLAAGSAWTQSASDFALMLALAASCFAGTFVAMDIKEEER